MQYKTAQSLNIFDFYIVLWCVYKQQEALFSSGGIVFQVILLVLLFLSAFYAYRVITQYKTPLYFRGLNVLLGVMAIYGLFLLLGNQDIVLRENGAYVQRFEYLKMLMISLLPIYVFYYFGRQGYITEKRLTIYALIFVGLAANSFFFSQSQSLAEGFSTERFQITNNVGYVFVAIIPLLALVKNNILKYGLLVVCITFAYLSIKRGAIITSTLSGLLFLLLSLKTSKKWNKVISMIALIAIVAGAYYLLSELIESNDYFRGRYEYTLSGEESTRDVIYNDLWNHFINNSSFLNIMFGNGAFSTTRFTINYAHSDWFEILIDQGLFGVLIYAFYWICFFKTWQIAKKRNNDVISISLLLVIVIYFLKSIFSMSFNNMDLYATFSLGYCLSQVNKKVALKTLFDK